MKNYKLVFYVFCLLIFLLFLNTIKVFSENPENCNDCQLKENTEPTIVTVVVETWVCNMTVELEKRTCNNGSTQIKILNITPENEACVEGFTPEDILSVVWYSLLVNNPLNLDQGTWVIKWTSCWKYVQKDINKFTGILIPQHIEPCFEASAGCCYTVVKAKNTTCEGVVGINILTEYGSNTCITIPAHDIEGCFYSCHTWINFHSRNLIIK
jgi:hypothetical protein